MWRKRLMVQVILVVAVICAGREVSAQETSYCDEVVVNALLPSILIEAAAIDVGQDDPGSKINALKKRFQEALMERPSNTAAAREAQKELADLVAELERRVEAARDLEKALDDIQEACPPGRLREAIGKVRGFVRGVRGRLQATGRKAVSALKKMNEVLPPE